MCVLGAECVASGAWVLPCSGQNTAYNTWRKVTLGMVVVMGIVILSLYERQKEWERDRDQERSSISWLSPQMPTAAGIGPGQSQLSGIPSRSLS